MTSGSDRSIFAEWLTALEARHLSDLRTQEVTRALRALSAGYVGRSRDSVRRSLETKGKRAAFALYYAPLHFLVTDHVVRALGADHPLPRSILDIGCGTGTAGAAWALAAGGSPITGVDRHAWAVEEARWTLRTLGIEGRVRQGDVTRAPLPGAGSSIVAAYVLNELEDPARAALEEMLMDAVRRGARMLIVEPVSRSISPWWDTTAARFASMGGRADEWRFTTELPPLLKLFDKAAGLDHRELTARSLYCP